MSGGKRRVGEGRCNQAGVPEREGVEGARGERMGNLVIVLTDIMFEGKVSNDLREARLICHPAPCLGSTAPTHAHTCRCMLIALSME